MEDADEFCGVGAGRDNRSSSAVQFVDFGKEIEVWAGER